MEIIWHQLFLFAPETLNLTRIVFFGSASQSGFELNKKIPTIQHLYCALYISSYGKQLFKSVTKCSQSESCKPLFGARRTSKRYLHLKPNISFMIIIFFINLVYVSELNSNQNSFLKVHHLYFIPFFHVVQQQ